MTALASMFSFLYVYFSYLVHLVFGGEFSTNAFSGEAHKLAFALIENHLPIDFTYSAIMNISVNFHAYPILQISLGVFVIGTIIGLAHRLIRG